MISLDGSTLEGGGQLVRVALALSAICRMPVRVDRIRANRAPRTPRGAGTHRGSGRGRDTDKYVSHKATTKEGSSARNDYMEAVQSATAGSGGLKESHLAALEWLADQTDAEVTGAKVGSCEVIFDPRKRPVVQSGRVASGSKPQILECTESAHATETREYTITLKSPGSVWLIWQAIYPFIVFGQPSSAKQNSNSPSSLIHYKITLRGGTNVSKSMSYGYLTQVFIPVCDKIGLPHVEIELVLRGWAGSAPQIGEAVISVDVPRQPFMLPAFKICDRGDIARVDITIIAAGEKLRTTIKDRIVQALKAASAKYPITWHSQLKHKHEELDIHTTEEESGHPRRLYILLVAHTSNGWCLGADYLGTGRLAKSEREQEQLISVAVKTVVSQFVREVERGGCVDEYTQDQLVIFQALALGRGRVDGGFGSHNGGIPEDESNDGKIGGTMNGEGSLHTRTVRWICEQVLENRGLEFGRAGQCLGVGWNSSEHNTATVHGGASNDSGGDNLTDQTAALSIRDDKG